MKLLFEIEYQMKRFNALVDAEQLLNAILNMEENVDMLSDTTIENGNRIRMCLYMILNWQNDRPQV